MAHFDADYRRELLDEEDTSWAMSLLDSFVFAITPSFLHRFILGQPTPPHKLHTIAALDGLRGVACLLVFNFHLLFTYTFRVMTGWGFGGENWGFHQLPIIHMLISGHVMVAIFFVISGYVLSHKPLKLLRSRNWEQAFQTLASSTFRRALRLYIPAITGLFLVLIAVRMGMYEYSTYVRDEGTTIRGINEEHPPYFESLASQLFHWYLTVVRLLDVWDWGLFYNYYNPHLWTIPVEFRSSIVLFLSILACGRLRPRWRLTLISLETLYCIRWGRWDIVLFLAGMILAEIDLICGLWDHRPITTTAYHPISDPEAQNTTTVNNPEKPRASSPATPSRRALWLAIFVIGLYIGSSPNSSPFHTPGFRFLASFTPRTYPEPHRFLQSVGAIIIVASINHSPDLQRVFTHPLAQYFGRISFAFYVVHGPILHSLGYSIMPSIWAVTGKETDMQYCLGFLIGWLICLPLSVWAGDVFWRAVDIPSVKFARWVESKVVVQ